MISINATLVLQIVHFLVLVFVLNRLMFKPILKLIGERTDHIETTKKRIEELELETERLRNEFNFTQNEARQEAFMERIQLRNSGMVEAGEYLSKYKEETSLMHAEVDKEAEEKVKDTKPKLKSEALGLADEIIEMMFGRRIEG